MTTHVNPVGQLTEIYRLANTSNDPDAAGIRDLILKLLENPAKLNNLSGDEAHRLAQLTREALKGDSGVDAKFIESLAKGYTTSGTDAGHFKRGVDDFFKDPALSKGMERFDKELDKYNKMLEHAQKDGKISEAEKKALAQQAKATEKAAKDLTEHMAKMGLEQGQDAEGNPRGARGGGAKSWLRAIAEALGKIGDRLANELQAAADKIGAGGNDPSAMVDFQVKSMEFQQWMQTATNALKALGEGINAPAQGARLG